MKPINISFLFFFLKLALIFLCLNQNVYGQQKSIDSLNYYYELANSPKTNIDLTSAYIFYEERKDDNLLKKDTINAIQDLRQIAIIQFELGLMNESENTTIEALSLLDNIKLNDSLIYEPKVGIYNHLGRVSDHLGEYNIALKYYNKVLSIERDSSRINVLLNNKALAYYRQGKYQLSIKNFKKAYESSLKYGQKKETARILSNLGIAKSKLNLSDALKDIQNALNIRKRINFEIGQSGSYLDLSEYYKDRNDKIKARFYIEKALEISKRNKNIKLKESVLSALIDLNNDPMVIEYKKLTDSLNTSKQNIRNLYSSKKYAYDKQEKIANDAKLKLKDSELIRTKQRSKITVSIAIVALITVFSFFMFFSLKSKHKKEKLQEVHNTESRISKRIHDELANDVYSSMVQLENNTASVSEVVNNLEDIYHKARDLSQEKMSISSNKEFIDDLKKSLASFNDDDTNVIVKGLIADIWIDISDEKKLTVYRVLKELLVNMRKHSKANLVSVTFSRKNNTIKIGYTDNGVGTYKNKTSKGVGLVNAENRIQAIGGSFIFDKSTKSGFKIGIEIPV